MGSCCPSSGGGDSNVTQTQVKEMPAWAQPYAQDLLGSGMNSINQPVQPFQGMRVAPMNQAQQVGLSMIQGRALSGSPDETAARQQSLATAQGGYLGSNPYAGLNSPYQSEQYLNMANPYSQMANPYLSEPYTQNAIEQNAQSMARGYATGTAAQMDSAASRARAMGGSGYQQAVGQNEQNLGNAIGNMANQYQLGKTGMGVQDLQQMRGLGSQDISSRMNLGVQNALQRSQMGLQDWQNERGNMMQSIPLGYQGSQLDYANAEKMLQAGGTQRGYQQQLLDQVYSDYMTQQNMPFQQIDRAGNLLGMAIGNSGQSTMTQTNNNNNNIGQYIGGALGAYGLYGAMNQPKS